MVAMLDETAECGMLHKGVVPSNEEVLLGGENTRVDSSQLNLG